MAGTTLALLGFAVLVVSIVALQHPREQATAAGTATTTASRPAASSTGSAASGSATQSSSPAPSSASSASSPSVTKLPLIVLNNTTVSHLARDASARFEAGGWTVTDFDNYQNDILSTCAYYDPDNPQAKAAAQALQRQFPTIKRVRPKFDGLPDGPIVVILTPDYTP